VSHIIFSNGVNHQQQIAASVFGDFRNQHSGKSFKTKNKKIRKILNKEAFPSIPFKSLGPMKALFWGLYHKTYYGHNLRNSVISLSVCPWQAFPA
jgi:hypothetical protein